MKTRVPVGFNRQTIPLLLLGVVLVTACGAKPTPTKEPVIPPTVGQTPTPIPQSTATETVQILPSPTATIYTGPILSLETGDFEYVIPLAIQRAMDQSIDVFFVLDRPGAGYLFFWPMGGDYQQGSSIPLRAETAEHYLRIPGLESGQRYMVTVGMEGLNGEYQTPALGGEVWAPISMQLPPTDGHIRIGVIGDSGFGEELTYELVEAMAEHSPDLVIHVGDVAYKTFQEGDPREAFIQKYFQPFSPLLHTALVYPVPGNHEYDIDTYLDKDPYYFHVFPSFPEEIEGDGLPNPERREWYAIEIGSTQLLLLNSQLLFQGRLVEEQTEWLQARLADDRFGSSIVVFHVPPYSSSRHSGEGWIVASSWGEILGQAGDRLVLSGHEHVYERLVVDGVTYLISGGGSSAIYSLVNPHPGSQFFASLSHYIILDVFPDRVEFVSYDRDDAIIDQGEVIFTPD